MKGIVLCFAAVMLSALGCSDSHPRNQEGGETHFLNACSDGTCPDELSCVCGVCTQTCESSGACGGLGSAAGCERIEPASLVCEGPAQSLRVCDVTCSGDDECEALGDDFQCIEGRCRPEAISSAVAAMAMDAAIDADVGKSCTDPECGAALPPLVMILLDTSGSMERQVTCECTTASCVECLPDCSAETPEKNRWTQTLEALTGTFDDFSCEPLERVAPDFTYDVDYVFPYHKPSGTQRDDGILQEFRDRVRFGIATFDGIAVYGANTQLTIDELDLDKSAGVAGLWSYPSEVETHRDGWATGQFKYPFCSDTYIMNTGIRSSQAEAGALILGTDWAERSATVEAIHQTLLASHPFGSTPTAAALDDLRVLFTSDPATLDERRNPERKRHLIVITDGRPDDDYRQVGCNCAEDGDDSDCGGPPNDPSEMTCPYPEAARAMRILRCGDDDSCSSGLFDSIHVVGLSVVVEIGTVEVLDAIARAGGDAEASYTVDRTGLRTILRALLDSIASGASDNAGIPEPIDAPLARKAACTDGAFIYASGASWSRACNTCGCDDGQVTCSHETCGACTTNDDCDGSVCVLDSDCTTGECGPVLADACDAPLNGSQFCGCDGETYSMDDCGSLAKGIKHKGLCD